MYNFNPRRNPTRRSSRACTASRRGCSSIAKRADDGWLRARTMAGAAAPCRATAKLTWVSLPARPRPHSVLLCVLTPWLSSMAQPDLRLLPVCGRRRSEAAMEAAFDSCQKAARGSSVAARRSSRRRPWCHRGGRLCLAQGHVRGPDGRGSSSLLPWAAWPVHPDPLPSWVAFGASVGPPGCVCSVIRKIVRT